MYPTPNKVKIKEEYSEVKSADVQYKEIKLRTIWPAVMFAANRNDSVIGRTIILVVSISTRNGFSHSGAPSGRKWAVDFFIEYENDEINILIQSGRPIESVKIKWLDDDKEYGIIPIRLIKISKINNEEIVIDKPFKLIDDVRDSWFIMNFIIGATDDSERLWIFHIFIWNSINSDVFNKIVIVGDGVNKLYVSGSKIEKISPIIKIWL